MTKTVPSPEASKEDPETLVLRANPKPVLRFKRPVLVGTAAVASAGILAITWLGLAPPTPKAARNVTSYDPDAMAGRAKPKPEALNSLPKSYDQVKSTVPLLGPPLPGDLGGPMLAKQRRLSSQDQPLTSGRTGGSAPSQVTSGVFFQVSPQPRGDLATGQVSGTESIMDVEEGSVLSSAHYGNQTKPSAVDRQASGGIYNTHSVQVPASPYQVMAGTVIAASLVTGLNSDLPGLVIAQLTAPVYDTVSGRVLLLPQGTRILGEYRSDIGFGQSRVLLVWKRFVMPDGSSLEIDNFPAADVQGYAGLQDRVDYHTWSLLKGVGLSTLLGLTSYSGDDDSDLVEAFRDGMRQTANQAGQRLVQKAIDIKPSLTVRPGWPVRVIVQKDLILKPYKTGEAPWPN
ncbi:TrbI/VirB10 family protein [Asticcacaulis sp.]|uniref:TrbI/VirB10 family protein n=1 Tax=Asticcacaulis sp. TaxID=1872648 RepID=UPI003F7C4721